MAHLGTLKGRGFVEWKDRSVSVAYWLHIGANRGMIGGQGTLDHEESLFEAFEQDKLTLRLSNGETVRILIDQMGSSGTHFQTSGIIPGGWEKMVRG